MGNSFFPNVSLTVEIYKASKHPDVRALFDMPSGDARDNRALQLIQQGHVLDYFIDVCNYDPVTIMGIRQQMGFTWVPNATQAPGNGVILTGPVPPGGIKVSTDAKDYPPFDPPVPPPVVGTNLVGRQLFGNLYTYGPGAVKDGKYTVTDGQLVTQDGAQYKARINAFAVGTQVYFEKQ